jgi:hypothetical protein
MFYDLATPDILVSRNHIRIVLILVASTSLDIRLRGIHENHEKLIYLASRMVYYLILGRKKPPKVNR